MFLFRQYFCIFTPLFVKQKAKSICDSRVSNKCTCFANVSVFRSDTIAAISGALASRVSPFWRQKFADQKHAVLPRFTCVAIALCARSFVWLLCGTYFLKWWGGGGLVCCVLGGAQTPASQPDHVRLYLRFPSTHSGSSIKRTTGRDKCKMQRARVSLGWLRGGFFCCCRWLVHKRPSIDESSFALIGRRSANFAIRGSRAPVSFMDAFVLV